MRTAIRTILVAALALGLLALFLRNVDFSEVGAAVRAARTDLLALAVALTLVVYFVRTVRWQYLLEPLGRTSFWVAFRFTVIGFAASAILPARAGEVLRPYLLARREGFDVAATFATIVVERVLDLTAVLLMLAAYLLWFDTGLAQHAPTLYRAVTLGAWITTPAALALLGLMVLLAKRPERIEQFLVRAERRLPASLGGRLSRVGRTFAEGLAIVRRPQRLLASFGWSLVIWALLSAEAWVVALAFDITMSYPGSWLITALLVVGIALPTPGGVGGFHEAFRLGVTTFFGAPNHVAVAAAILLHAVSFGPVLLIGLWAAAYEGMSVGGLRQLQRSERTIG